MAHKTGPGAGESLAVRPERAAELLDVSRATIYNLMARGELPSFMIGRARRVTVQAIKDYVARRQAGEEVKS